MTDKTNSDFVRSFVSATTTGTFFHDLLRLHRTRRALIPLQLQELDGANAPDNGRPAAA